MSPEQDYRILITQWQQRETNYLDFVSYQLADFWSQRQEFRFIGKDNVSLQAVRLCKPGNDKVIIIVNGFTENYLKYQELIYDLLHSGYDVMTYDHRGQGQSDRILTHHQRVYVEYFSDYVDDLQIFWHNFVKPRGYRRHFLLGHSMGGAISALFLLRQPNIDAAILTAPMTGIALPMPQCLAECLARLATKHHRWQKSYAMYQPRPLPFILNRVTHSRSRYGYCQQLLADNPQLAMLGPTWHWLHEALSACHAVQQSAVQIKHPLLLLQAGKEKLVSNKALNNFHQQRLQAKVMTFTPDLAINERHMCCQGDGLIIFHQARHEILFEKDVIRAKALYAIQQFLAHYH